MRDNEIVVMKELLHLTGDPRFVKFIDYLKLRSEGWSMASIGLKDDTQCRWTQGMAQESLALWKLLKDLPQTIAKLESEKGAAKVDY